MIASVFSSFFNVVASKIKSLVATYQDEINTVGRFLKTLFDINVTIFDGIISIIGGFVSGVIGLFRRLFSIIAETAGKYKEGFEAIKKGDVKGALQAFGQGLVKANPVGLFITEGRNLADGFKEGFQKGFEALSIKKIAGDFNSRLQDELSKSKVSTSTEIDSDLIAPTAAAGASALTAGTGKRKPIVQEIVFEVPDADILSDIDLSIPGIDNNLDVLGRQNAALASYRDGLTLAADKARLFGAEGGELLQAQLQFTNQAIQSAIDQFGVYSPEVAALKEQYDLLNLSLEKYNLQQQSIIDLGPAIQSGVIGLAETFAGSLGKIAAGAGGLQILFTGLVDVLAGVLEQVGKLAIQTGVAMLAIKKALKFGNPVVAIAAGAALVALSSFVKAKLAKAAPGLAEGGIIPPGFSNDTFPAFLSSGEAVIPLDRLPGLVGATQGGYIAETRIDGQDLVIMLRKAESNINRFG